jgi:signal peptidase I
MADETNVATKIDHSKQEGSVKETIESILVAFILAFIFRAFVVEAFVIPTGSMGPTLMGAHMRLQCPDCGYRFAVNYSSSGGDDTNIDSWARTNGRTTEICPNCGFPVLLKPEEPVYFGDRILVLKYRYLFDEPERWDVVVFKSPYEKNPDPKDPKYVDNYIKRLVGKPGESIMILDGDIYVGRPGMNPKEFVIQRKPKYAQDALWREIYNNDYESHGLDRGPGVTWRQPWEVEAGSGWSGPYGGNGPSDRRFRFSNAAGSSALRFDPNINHSFNGFTDWIDYDQRSTGSMVTDLKLSCVYRRTAGQGPLRLQLTKNDDCFTAEFVLGKVILHRDRLADATTMRLGEALWEKPIEVEVPELKADDSPVEIDFSNVDYRVTVRINHRDVIATTDAQYYPNVEAMFKQAESGRADRDKEPIARMVGENQSGSLDHIRLARDVFYFNNGTRYTAEGNGSSGLPFWASPQNIQNLGPDEYFVLGDNSLVSLDARYWGAPVDLPHEGDYHVSGGKVPGRFLLGKAFFVYWPAGYRPLSTGFGIEPDFADMRFIH